MVGVPRTVIAASSTSPLTVPVGLASSRLLPPVLAAEAEPRRAICPVGAALTVIETVAAAENSVPSVTRYVKASGPE